MRFNSFHYMVFFVGIVLITDAVRSLRLQHLVLLLASYYFYWASSSSQLILLILCCLWSFYCGTAIHEATSPRRRRLYLYANVAVHLGVLGYFKYAGWAVSTVSTALQKIGWGVEIGRLDIVLPIGISFFTFQSMSYTLDIYFRTLTADSGHDEHGFR